MGIPGGAASGARTDIGKALIRVLTEIDEITVATLKSVTLATLLKSMPGPEQSKTGATAAPGS